MRIDFPLLAATRHASAFLHFYFWRLFLRNIGRLQAICSSGRSGARLFPVERIMRSKHTQSGRWPRRQTMTASASICRHDTARIIKCMMRACRSFVLHVVIARDVGPKLFAVFRRSMSSHFTTAVGTFFGQGPVSFDWTRGPSRGVVRGPQFRALHM